jgi:hypothetical protein
MHIYVEIFKDYSNAGWMMAQFTFDSVNFYTAVKAFKASKKITG